MEKSHAQFRLWALIGYATLFGISSAITPVVVAVSGAGASTQVIPADTGYWEPPHRTEASPKKREQVQSLFPQIDSKIIHHPHSPLVVESAKSSTGAASHASSAMVGNKAASLPTPSSSQNQLHPLPPIAQLGVKIVGCLLPFVAFGLAQLASRASSQRTKVSVPGDPFWATMQSALDTLVAAVALAVDGAAASAVVPMLPGLAGGHGAFLLFFARPVVALSTVVVLPLFLRGGAHRGRFAQALGLVLLAMACLMQTVFISLNVALAARIASSVASAMILAPALYTAMLRAPAEQMAWRICCALCAAALGAAVGPHVGAMLTDFGGPSAAMASAAVMATVTCCAQLAVSRWVLDVGADMRSINVLEFDFQGSVFRLAKELLQDMRLMTLLAGVTLVAALLALYGLLVPIYFDSDSDLVSNTAAGPPVFPAREAAARTALAVALLACGLKGQRTGGGGMVFALALCALGLRAVAEARGDGHPWIASVGLLASHLGAGGYLGLALPTLLRLVSSNGSADDCPRVPVAAVTGAAVAAAWLLGDALGVALQMVLSPLVGAKHTILVFAAIAAGHCVTSCATDWFSAKRAAK